MSTRDLPDLRAGLYSHYKGPLYQAIGYGHDANLPDRDVVVYIGLQLDGAHKGPRLAVRTVNRAVYTDHDAWDDLVCVTHGGVMGRCPPSPHEPFEVRPRFEYRGPQYYGGSQHTPVLL